VYNISEITTIQNKKTMSDTIYNMAVGVLEAPITTLPKVNGHYTTLGDELALTDNANQDGFKFSCDEECPLFGDFCHQYNITMEMFPTFYSSHVGVRLAIFSRSSCLYSLREEGLEVPDDVGTDILSAMSVEQLAKIKTAMLWIEKFYKDGVVLS
jgi:hypothetical protein